MTPGLAVPKVVLQYSSVFSALHRVAVCYQEISDSLFLNQIWIKNEILIFSPTLIKNPI